MSELTEEEKQILRKAYEIKERIRAEELEAGETSLEEAVEESEEIPPVRRRPRRELTAEEERKLFGPGAPENAEKAASGKEGDTPPRRSQDVPQKRPQQVPGPRGSQKRQNKRLEHEMERHQQQREQEQGRKRNADRKAKEKAGKKKGILRRLLKLFLIILIVIAVLLACTYAFLRATIARTNYKPYETTYERGADVLSAKGVTNILLIGTDTRVPGSDDTRSDAMIVISINPYKHRLVMTSILRDSYVNIPGYGQNRINEAYSRGGASLLIQTIEENYKLGIDYYVQVDFFNFVEVIDAFGGVTVTIEQPEVEFINGYVSEYNHIIGAPEGDQFLDALTPGGEITLTGRQALGYARIRKIGTDFARTERQRTVLNALLDKAKKANILTIYRAVDSILPDLTTNISDEKMCSLLLQAVLYLNFDMVQARVPADNTWSNAIMGAGQEVLAVDFAANREYLKATIYD